VSYHPLSNDSGSDENRRIEEARTIVRMLEEVTEQMTQKERDFVEQMADCDYCTVKQVFWLRDIKDKYL
jgi:hypothetical protein